MNSPRLTALWVLVMMSLGCAPPRSTGADEGSSKPVVVATTTMLADLAKQLGGEDFEVHGIMAPGGDPHLYQPTPADARLIARSNLVVTSGLHLEGWIDDLVRNAGGERPIVVASDGVRAIAMSNSPGGVDPHFWFDLEAWRQASSNVAGGLRGLGDGEAGQTAVDERAAAYTSSVDALDGWVRTRLGSIPKQQRVLITSHDAFNYFGRAYNIDVVGIQGISTQQEASQRDVANVIDLVRARKAPAIFIESSVNPALIQQVARETGTKVAGPLYSDSIGALDGPAGTFTGTVVENVRMITEALGGAYAPFGAAGPKAEALPAKLNVPAEER